MKELYPLRFEETYVEKIWGGRNLESILGKVLPPGCLIGESWEIWLENQARNGLYKGWTLETLARKVGPSLTGSRGRINPKRPFPLLAKFIDAQDILSIQVHPDDEYARKRDGEPWGKTEAWYIIHAEPGAKLIHGFRDKLTRAELKSLIEEGHIAEFLYELEVKPGDVIFIPAGTVHALKKGILLFEIQQCSDMTYRIFDWNRLNVDGKPRPLHIEKALDVARLDPWKEHKVPGLACEEEGNRKTWLIACRYFALELWELGKEMRAEGKGLTFQIYSLLEGKITVKYGPGLAQAIEVEKGQSFLIPAGLGLYVLCPEEGLPCLLRAYIPDLWHDVVYPLRKKGFGLEEIVRLGGDAPYNDLTPLLQNL